MRRTLAALAAGVVLLSGCMGPGGRKSSEALFVGIDVSGSFQRSEHFEDAMEFMANYLYARLNAKGDLQGVKTLFVGSLGGRITEENKSFFPIEDFQRKSPEQILADLKARFPESDKMTDFNIFFRQVADIARKRNLSLSPITVVLLTDGMPDVGGAPIVKGEAERPQDDARFTAINLTPLEYLSRKVTVRLLYPSPVVTSKWEKSIERKRVRMWTVDHQVMTGWKAQYDAAKGPDDQELLWKWISQNVDFRVRSSSARFSSALASASSEKRAE